jgi:hypothetical protein
MTGKPSGAGLWCCDAVLISTNKKTFNQGKTAFMKATVTKLPQSPVFPKTLHHVRTRTTEPAPHAKLPKRDNIFSKSRDLREDRGERQIKTSHNPQTFSRGR